MQAQDSAQSHYYLQYRNTVITYDRTIKHADYGLVRMLIRRAIGNDSGLKVRLTKELLEAHEPKVGMWPGDVIEIYDSYGKLLERKT